MSNKKEEIQEFEKDFKQQLASQNQSLLNNDDIGK